MSSAKKWTPDDLHSLVCSSKCFVVFGSEDLEDGVHGRLIGIHGCASSRKWLQNAMDVPFALQQAPGQSVKSCREPLFLLVQARMDRDVVRLEGGIQKATFKNDQFQSLPED